MGFLPRNRRRRHTARRKILLLRKVLHKALLNPVNKSRRISMNQISLKDLELGNHQRRGRKPTTPISLGLTSYRPTIAPLPWALKLATLESTKTTFHHLHDLRRNCNAIDMKRNLKKPPIKNTKVLRAEEPLKSSEKPQISR
jgi:hypothetical protein